MTPSHIQDVFQHMSWADAAVWSAVFSSEAAKSDEYVTSTFFHIHSVQHSFFSAWKQESFQQLKQDGYPDAESIAGLGRDFHAEVAGFVAGLSAEDLDGPLVLPWAKYFARALGRQPQDTTLAETIHQLPSHSMHHRGQILRRLRELDVKPPTIDYIVWVWSGRPEAEWSF